MSKQGILIAFCCVLISCNIWKAEEINIDESVDLSSYIIVELGAKKLEVDKLGFIYVLTKKNKLKKYDSKGKELYEYSNSLNGEIFDFDVSNPMKIIVFFKDFQQLISLDNTLSPLHSYALQELGFKEISCVSLSNDNHMWLYDLSQLKLVKIKENGSVLFSNESIYSDDLEEFEFNKIIESSNYLALRSNNQIVILDNYGERIRSIYEPNEELIKITPKYIYFLSKNTLKSVHIEDVFAEIQIIRNFEQELKDLAFTDNILILNEYGVQLLH